MKRSKAERRGVGAAEGRGGTVIMNRMIGKD